MELDNHQSRQAYVQLLIDTLKKKIEILNRLMLFTEQQEELIASEGFDEEEFMKLISLKQEQIDQLTKLDAGFEQLYESVKEDLEKEKAKFKEEISILKEQIITITDLSIKLQALEKRNKTKLETIFSVKRRDIKSSRMSNQTVANYYKSMSQQQNEQSFFYDKKN